VVVQRWLSSGLGMARWCFEGGSVVVPWWSRGGSAVVQGSSVVVWDGSVVVQQWLSTSLVVV